MIYVFFYEYECLSINMYVLNVYVKACKGQRQEFDPQEWELMMIFSFCVGLFSERATHFLT